MKNIILVLFIAYVFTSCATKPAFNSFYNDNKEDSEFSLSAPAFMANLFIPKEDIEGYEDLFKRVKHYKLLIFSDETNSLEKKFNKFINHKNYTSIFRISENGNKVQFYFLENKNVIKEIVLKIKSDDSYVILGLKTNILERDFIGAIGKSTIKVTSNK